MMKFYQISGKSMSRKQKALYNFLLDKLKEYQEILIVGLDNKDEKYTPTLNVINGDEFLSLNQNGLAICNVYPEDELYEYEVVTFYDTSDAQENGEGLVYQISRHTSGQSTDELGSSTWFTISQEGKLVQTDQQLSLFQSRKPIKSSVSKQRVKEELDNTYYGIENPERYYDIQFNINWEDIPAFATSWNKSIDIDPREIVSVEYDDSVPSSYQDAYNMDYDAIDGAYIVKFKDGTSKSYGWTYGGDKLIPMNDRVYSYSFDYIITHDVPVKQVENIILRNIQGIDGIEVVGNPGINNTSWSKEEYGITSSFRSRKPIKSSRGPDFISDMDDIHSALNECYDIICNVMYECSDMDAKHYAQDLADGIETWMENIQRNIL